MAKSTMEKTRYPGIYRRGSRYVVAYRDGRGRQRKQAARTLDEARKVKRALEADRDRGELRERSQVRFREFAEEWVERYQGTGRRGFRESTREDYRDLLARFVFPFFDDRRRLKLTEVTPSDVADFVAWLCDPAAMAELEHRQAVEAAREAGKPEPKRRRDERPLADTTIRNVLNPVRSCFATAMREGMVRSNPCAGAALPHRERVEDDDAQEVRSLTREQLAAFLAVVHPRHRLMFQLLAATGLRVSELIALQWRHLSLDGSDPCVRVRRALVRGRVQPPKSRHGRRDVPLSASLVSALRVARQDSEWPGDEDLVFPSMAGTPQKVENVRRRVLRPAAEEAGAPWAGFHSFRHTCATMLFADGRNVKQVQRWLGHHSPSFTLDTYVHLLDEGLAEPLELPGAPELVAVEYQQPVL
jgi:integrase